MTSWTAGAVEKIAKKIYEAMRFEREGDTPVWVAGGNSFAQNRAREAAQTIILLTVDILGKQAAIVRAEQMENGDA